MHSVVVGCLEVENGESHFFWSQIVLIAWGVKGNIHLLAITTLCLDLMGDSPLLLTSSYYVGNSFQLPPFFFFSLRALNSGFLYESFGYMLHMSIVCSTIILEYKNLSLFPSIRY